MIRPLGAPLGTLAVIALAALAAPASAASKQAGSTDVALAVSGSQVAQATPAVATDAAAPGQLTAQQQETLSRVSASFNKVDTLTGDFVQVGPDGSRSEGKFALAKPGKIRFTYAAPSRIDVVSDGSSVAVRDRKLATQDIWPLSQTPLRFLLQSRIDLLKDANVVAVYTDADMISVVMEEKSTLAGNSRLTLMFGTSDYALKQWTVTDAQGADTSVAIYNLAEQAKVDPKLFTIDFTRLQGSK